MGSDETPEADTEQHQLISKYSEILCENFVDDKISCVSCTALDDEKLGHRACHVETVTVTFTGGKRLELFAKHRLERNCPALEKQLTAVMLNEGKFLLDFVDEMKIFFKQQQSTEEYENLISDMVPRTFYCDEEIIVMENLLIRGYRPLPQNSHHDFHHAKLVLQNLARLHATTHAMIQWEGGMQFLHRHLNFKNPLLNPDLMHFFSKAFEHGLRASLKILQNSHHPEKNEKYEFLKKFQGQLEETILDIIRSKSLLLSVCHGNLGSDNILFGGEGPDHSKVIFVDFQTSKVGSPNLDLGYYFFRAVNSDTRRRWMELLQIYFESFSQTVSFLGHPMSFSFEDFLLDFAEKSKLGFIFGVFLASGCAANTKNDEEISTEIINIVNDHIIFSNTKIDQ